MSLPQLHCNHPDCITDMRRRESYSKRLVSRLGYSVRHSGRGIYTVYNNEKMVMSMDSFTNIAVALMEHYGDNEFASGQVRRVRAVMSYIDSMEGTYPILGLLALFDMGISAESVREAASTGMDLDILTALVDQWTVSGTPGSV